LAEQRERLLAATAFVVAREASPSVASIVRRAGAGRNTFYEYFDDVQHAVEAAQLAVVRRISELLELAENDARTPVERWRSLARAWLAFAEEEPEAMRCVLAIEARAPDALSSAALVLEAAFARSLETLRSAGVTSPPPGAERVRAVAAVGEAFARVISSARGAADDQDSGPRRDALGGAWERERLERALADVAVRLLR
jgi:AcrR family transcriptional regulator